MAERTESKTGIVPFGTEPPALDGVPRLTKLAFAFAAKIKRGTLTVTLPDGRRFVFGGAEPGPQAEMVIRSHRFAWRLARGGDIGIAEAYLRREWDTPDLPQFLYLFTANHELVASMLDGNPVARLWQVLRHWLNRNTKAQAKKNIHAHYDIGNAFYTQWLDDSMTYSSAIFEPGVNDLSAAQTAKYRALAQALQIKPGMHVLEIGCGWGGFAEYVARECGARVTGLTISREQLDYARARIEKAGLSDRVEFKFQDYRDEQGVYDRIASIEMIEAVGEQFWPSYFRQLRDRLVPGGLAGVQAITIQDGLFSGYRKEIDFIRRYVFPGGMLPAPSILRDLGEHFGIPVVRERIFGEDYAKTLAIWRENFHLAWPRLSPLGFDERFRRLWDYYLSYCEAGFRAGIIDVRQIVFAKSA